MIRLPKCWILVADGNRARVISPDWHSHSWRTIESWTADHSHSEKFQGERPGRSFESANPMRHGMAPHHEPQEVDRQKFARRVASALNAGKYAGAFEELVLVAQKKLLGALREHLRPDVITSIALELDRDLTGQDDKSLFEHLAALPGGMKWRRLTAV